MDKQAIFDKLKAALIEDFEMDEAKVTPEARLYEDLELDSIDAVDLIVKLKSLLPTNIDPEVFKTVRTVQDVVDAIYNLIQNADKK
ncbi:MAG: acyl carrier protein [Fibrobacter sp.]|jgi:acyl carrier protein|uniref:acyl carrier protein n=1 Tax=unclassified Fibrobacter TaxID=2634177 RepID=UPI00091209F3|nr:MULTISPECIES: acyl carrier protein [unclassified Fibrobacter]MBO5532172.1 acyl carrier protein [Fibrobacter sp.]MBR6317592.1 acyl carrier protein [Fibrobacter sp.]MBS7271917.1 acyl carrier protein [Fibrobacter sp.]MDD5943255.1 acyl carrier protein [Fibrobacter sp.]MDY6264231.1 acyl carrier protein [Fibrobacter sp.]